MSTWNYTKQISIIHPSEDSVIAHENNTDWTDWFYNQVEAGLADSTLRFLPHAMASALEVHILCTNQAQVDSLLAVQKQVDQNVGFDVQTTVSDVAYTDLTMPDNFF